MEHAVTPTVMRFNRGAFGASRLEESLHLILQRAHLDDSFENKRLSDSGLRPEDVRAARIDVAEGEQGLDPFLTPIIVSIVVAGGTRMAETLWDEVLWPALRRRLGADALGASDDRSQNNENQNEQRQ